MSKFIDLSLKQISKGSLENITIDKAIKDNILTVILGAPGSGKSSILKKYAEENEHCKLLKIKEFLKLEIKIPQNTETLLLDGMDEYRSIESDKVFVTTKLASQLNEILKEKKLQIVLTCREMDWYGENDVNALSNGINITPEIYQLLPLDATQKNELAEICNIEYARRFIDKFSKYGLLENPQMFVMMAKLHNDNTDEILESKKELYLTYIKRAREQNSDYTCNELNLINPDDFIKITGYIAAFYIFQGIDRFDDKFVDKISSPEGKQTRDNIKLVLRSSRLFTEKCFYHRTIAEFALAYFLNNIIKNKQTILAFERIKNLFVKNDRIPTELRGTFAWLCSFSMDKKLIFIDPYYQAIHGDSSAYNTELKKQIILEVKKYANNIEPHFQKDFQEISLDNYYEEALDDFIKIEFKEGRHLKNHYIFFIIEILTSSNYLSDNIKDFLKEKMFDADIEVYIKIRIIQAFANDIDFLKSVLLGIKQEILKDTNDSLKSLILSMLYPDNIPPDSLAKYLLSYSTSSGETCLFLVYADFKKKLPLAKKIYELLYKRNKEKFYIPDHLKFFIEDFFADLINQYDNNLNENEIFNILKKFRQYYQEYEKIYLHPHRTKLKKDLKSKQETIQILANNLYSIYIDYLITQGTEIMRSQIYNFHNFFPYEIQPNNKTKILFSKISENHPDFNEILFLAGIYALPKEEREEESIKKLAKKLNILKKYKVMLNPPKSQWEIEDEKRQAERKKALRLLIEENEKYFARKTDEELQNDLKTLNFIAEKSSFSYDYAGHREVTRKTFNRLNKILKNAIKVDSLAPELTTLKSLVETAPTANRNIDRVYSSSTALQKNSNIIIIKDEFFKYLYINDLCHCYHYRNNDEKSFSEQIEDAEPEYAILVLKEYIAMLYNKYIGKSSVINKYIDNIDSIQKLHNLIKMLNNNSIKEDLIYTFLKVFNFTININDLESLFYLSNKSKNQLIIKTLTNFNNKDFQNITLEMGVALFSLLDLAFKQVSFKPFDPKIKVNLLYLFLNLFNTEKLLEFIGGGQSPQQQCASFLNRHALASLTLDELHKLEKLREYKEDIWANRIKSSISDEMQKMADNDHALIKTPKSKQVESLRDFFLSGSILSANDFFVETYLQIKELQTEIEDNRNNEKNVFYSADNTPKDENDCRDIFLSRLEDRNRKKIVCSREKHEADNRVDINIKYQNNPNFEVQIECKKDKNSELYSGIEKQLIKKYLSSAVQYGIYLVFFFEENKDKQTMIERLQNNIPKEYKSKIEVICIDLKKNN